MRAQPGRVLSCRRAGGPAGPRAERRESPAVEATSRVERERPKERTWWRQTHRRGASRWLPGGEVRAAGRAASRGGQGAGKCPSWLHSHHDDGAEAQSVR